jgi:PAS domain S-box-containing protein
MPHGLYVLPLYAATFILTAIGLFAWRHRRSTPGAKAFALLMLAAAQWALAYGFSLTSPTMESKLFWVKVRYLGIVLVPWAWLIFALLQTGLERFVTRVSLTLLAVEPLVALLMVWTNEWHWLYWTSVKVGTAASMAGISVTRGPLFWGHVIYSYLIVLFGSFLLVRAAIRSPRPYRRQSIAMLISAIGPLLGDIVSTFGLTPAVPWLDVTPFFFVLTGLTMLWGVFRLRMLDIVPIARDAIIEHMSDGVIILDSKSNVIDLNPAAQSILDCAEDEVVGSPVSEVLPTLPFDPSCPTHKAVIETETGSSKLHYDMRTSPLLNRGDGLDGYLIVLSDTTERRQAEVALRESEHKYRILIEQSLQGFGVAQGIPLRFVFANSALTEILGYTPEELTSLPPTDSAIWIHPDEREGFIERYRACLAGETISPRSVLRIIRKDGTVRWVEVLASCIEYQWKPAMQAAFIDVTEHRQMQEALLQRNRELEVLNRASQALGSTLDLDQVLVAVLEEVRYLMQVSACSVWLVESETGKLACQQATGPRSDVIRTWRLSLGEGIVGWTATTGQSVIVPDIWTDERRFGGFTKELGWPLRSVLTTPLRVQDTVIGVLQVLDERYDRFEAMDLMLLEPLAMTAAMAIENARLYEQARRDSNTKSTLLRELNHRVNNSLSAIIGLLYAARRRTEMKAQSPHLSFVNDLIHRLQGLATLYSLLSESEWTPLLLCEVSAWVIRSSLQTLSSQRWVTVDVSPSPVRVTPEQAHDLTLVINELTTNTVKHALQEDDLGHIAVQISHDGDTILFKFQDNGPGYPDRVHELTAGNAGLELIEDIVRHNLHGELSMYNDSGAVAEIRFVGSSQEATT